MELAQVEQKIRKSISADQLHEWMLPRPGRVVRDLAQSWIVIAVAIPAVAAHPVWWAWCLAFLAIGFAQYGLFILGHEAMHGCLSTRRQINDSLSRWLIHGPLLMCFDDGRHNHLEHHKKLGQADDPDRYLHVMENKNNPISFVLFCSGLSTFWQTVLKVTPLGIVLNRSSASSQADGSSPTGALADFCLKRGTVFVWQPLLFSYFMVWGLPWWSYVVLWILPIYACVFVPDEIRAFCDHAVADVPDAEVDHKRLVTFLPVRLEKIVFSPHHMNYHAEHHLWPGIPYYNRPIVHKVLKETPEVTYRGSYATFLIRLLCRLPISTSAQTR